MSDTLGLGILEVGGQPPALGVIKTCRHLEVSDTGWTLNVSDTLGLGILEVGGQPLGL